MGVLSLVNVKWQLLIGSLIEINYEKMSLKKNDLIDCVKRRPRLSNLSNSINQLMGMKELWIIPKHRLIDLLID